MIENTGTTKYKQGDVWLANIYFKEIQESKLRPVLIIGNDQVLDLDAVIAPISTSQPRNPFDVVIEQWQAAGLERPSIVRTSKPTTIFGNELKRKLGELQPDDLQRVLTKFRGIV